MSEKLDLTYIERKLHQSAGGGNVSEMTIVIQPKLKKTTVRLSVETIQYFPIEEIEEVEKMYNKLKNIHIKMEELL